MRVLQLGGGADLPEEALGPQGGRQLGMQHLEGDQPVMLKVVREVDRGHPAAPELALDRVAIGQIGPEPLRGLGQKECRVGISPRYSLARNWARAVGCAFLICPILRLYKSVPTSLSPHTTRCSNKSHHRPDDRVRLL